MDGNIFSKQVFFTNMCQFDVDITSILRKQNNDEFLPHFAVLFYVILMGKGSMSFPRTLLT